MLRVHPLRGDALGVAVCAHAYEPAFVVDGDVVVAAQEYAVGEVGRPSVVPTLSCGG